MRSFLIIGGTQKERGEKAKSLTRHIHPIDTVILSPDPSIGINAIRDLEAGLFLKPVLSAHKVGLIFEAQKMTVPAQNALLKTLEEPPGESLLILSAPNTEVLLPTIVSRCHIIKLAPKTDWEIAACQLEQEFKTLSQVLTGGVGERLSLAEQIAGDRQEVINWLKTQIILWRHLLLMSADCTNFISIRNTACTEKLRGLVRYLSLAQIAETLKKVKKTQRMIEANVHLRLALDNLLLSYPKIG